MSQLAEHLFDESIRQWVVNIHADEHDVLIDRRTPFGNPFKVDHFDGPADGRLTCGLRYVRWLQEGDEIDRYSPRWVLEHLGELRGERLGCHCAPALCHGMVLAELAYAEMPPLQKLRELEKRLESTLTRAETIGPNMKRFRVDQGLPLRKVAERSGIEQVRLSKIERQQALAKPDEELDIAEALDVTLKALETGERQVDDEFDPNETTMHPHPDSNLRR